MEATDHLGPLDPSLEALYNPPVMVGNGVHSETPPYILYGLFIDILEFHPDRLLPRKTHEIHVLDPETGALTLVNFATLVIISAARTIVQRMGEGECGIARLGTMRPGPRSVSEVSNTVGQNRDRV